MIKYIPFLKFKTNEIQSLTQLNPLVRSQIAPLFDVPRTNSTMDERDVKKRLRIASNGMQNSRKTTPDYRFFLDNYDIDDSIDLSGIPQYRSILSEFSGYPISPVLAFDRHTDHNPAALDFVKTNNSDIAIRLQHTDIESYTLTKLRLNSVWPAVQLSQPKNIILLIDLRVIGDTADSQFKIESFLNSFKRDFQVSAIVVSGSIIPANIATLIGTNEEKHVSREEYVLWQSLHAKPDFSNVLYGDYCVVSPEYSDLDIAPELLSSISTPKVFYPHGSSFYIVRGRAFKSHGHQQYFNISDSIVNSTFYRGMNYSVGDAYIYDRSHLPPSRPDKAGSPGSWVKSSTTAHITFIVNTI